MQFEVPQSQLKPISVACLLALSPLAPQAQSLSITDGTSHVLSPSENLTTSADGTAGFGVLVRNPNSALEADGLTIVTNGQEAAGVKLESSGTLSLKGGSIHTDTPQGTSSSAAYGVWVTGKGLAELDGTRVSTSGGFAYGLYAYTDPAPGQAGIVARDVNVSTTGASAHGAVAASKGVLDLTRTTITTSGDGARAVSVQRGTLTMADSALVTSGANAPGLMVVGDGSGVGSTAVVTNSTIKTTGSQSRGLMVDNASSLRFSGGSIETSALDGNGSLSAYGAWVTGGSNAEFDSTKISTQGNYAYGLFSTYAPTLTDTSIDAVSSTVETAGANAHGVFATSKSVIHFDSGHIQTSGINAVGARAEAGGVLSLDGGAITTLGDNAVGLMATANASGVQASATARNVDIVTDGQNSVGVAAFQQGSTVTLIGGSVETHGAGSNGLSAEATAVVAANGTRVTTQGPTAFGARAYYSGYISLQDTVIDTYGSGSSGLYANGSSRIDAASSTITTHGSGAAGVELLSAGSVFLDRTRIETLGADSSGILGSFSAEGTDNFVSLTDSTVQAQGSAIDVFKGRLLASLKRSTAIGVNGVVLNSADHLEVVADDESYLSGAALKEGAGVLNLALAGNSRWDITGSSSLTSLSNSASLISFAPPENPADASQYKQLRVEQYVGEGGTIALNTWLGGTGSPSDTVVVDGGHASGSTALVVRNTAGAGALTSGDGIKIVDVLNGGTTESDAFSLKDRVAAGAYEYRLYRGGSESADAWFLRSTLGDPVDPESPGLGKPAPDYRVEVPLNMALPALANRYGLAMLGTYHDRNGEDYAPSTRKRNEESSSWGRAFGATGSAGKRGYRNFVKNGASYDYDLAGIEVGQDIYRREHATGVRDIAGLYVGAGTISSDVNAATQGRAGSASLTSFSIGGYWTRKSATGAYLDGVVQGTYYHDIKASSIGDAQSVTQGYGGMASIEAGHPVTLSPRWSLEPQAQMIYQYLSIDDTQDGYGRMAFAATHNGYARGGARVTYQAGDEDSQRATVWLRANLWQQFGEKGRVVFSSLDGNNSVSMDTQLAGTWGQIGLGVSGQLSERVSVFASADYDWTIDGQKGHAVMGRAGMRIQW